jgi:hypothetical protein
MSSPPLSVTLPTVRRALEVLGTKERLAAALNITLGDLDAYLEGEKPVPMQVFFDAVDIVGEHRQADD